MSVIEQLERLGIDEVCEDAEKWIESHPDLDIQGLWDICPRGDWMLYFMNELGTSAPYSEMAYEFAAHAMRHIASHELREACCDVLDVLSWCIEDDDAAMDEALDVELDADRAATWTARDATWAVEDPWNADRAALESVLAAVDSVEDPWAANRAAMCAAQVASLVHTWLSMAADRVEARATEAAKAASQAVRDARDARDASRFSRDAAMSARAEAWVVTAARAAKRAQSVAWDAGSAAHAARVAARVTRDAARAAQADIIRRFVPAPEIGA